MKSLLHQSEHRLSQSRPVQTAPATATKPDAPNLPPATRPLPAGDQDVCEPPASQVLPTPATLPMVCVAQPARPAAARAAQVSNPSPSEDRVAALRAELDRTQAQNRTLAADRDAAQASVNRQAQLQRENQALTHDTQHLRMDLSSARDMHQAQSRTVETLRSENALLTRDKRSLETTLREERSENALLTRDKRSLETTLREERGENTRLARDKQSLEAALREERTKPPPSPVYIEPNAVERAQ